MSDPSLDYLADRTRPPGYALLRVTQRSIEASLDGKHGSGLARLYAEEIVRLQRLLRIAVERVERLEELVNLPLDRKENKQ